MHELAAVLSRWRAFGPRFTSEPTCIRELSAGRTNRSYLIAADRKRWVLRVSAPHAAALGIDRAHELALLRAAGDAGLAPAVAYSSADMRILITDYIEGRPLSADAVRDAALRSELFDLIERIHTLSVDIPIADFYAHTENYRSQLLAAHVAIPANLEQVRSLLHTERRQFAAHEHDSRLCHRDLIPDNIIQHGDKLVVIDWEYAARGWRAFDYATIAAEWNIPLATLAAASGFEPDYLRHAVRLYRYTCDLWHLLNAHAGAARNRQPAAGTLTGW
jgi:thiamine kinase-like enzyme